MLAAALLLASSASASSPAPLAPRTQVLIEAPAEALAAHDTGPLDAMMMEFVGLHSVPAATLAVCRDGELVYARGFRVSDANATDAEPITADARFRIASLSKPITAVCVLRLVEQGRLALDANPFRVIGLGEALAADGRDPRLVRVTIEQLLHHSAGWDRDDSFDPMFAPDRVQAALALDGPPGTADIIRFMLDQPLDHAPGTHYAYSNFGYCVLGRVIEAVTGQSYADAARSLVFEPLGLASFRLGRSLPEHAWPGEVRYHDPRGRVRPAVRAPDRRVPIAYAHDQEVLDAHGGWVASAPDLARFAAAFADPEDCPLLEAATIRRMWAKPVRATPPVWYAMGWSVRDLGDGRVNAWHTGLLTGGTSTLLVRRHDGFTWAVLFNTDRSASNGSVLAGMIDPLIHRAVDTVEDWGSGSAHSESVVR